MTGTRSMGDTSASGAGMGCGWTARDINVLRFLWLAEPSSTAVAGPIGNLVAQAAKGLGASAVMITDMSQFRLDLAGECGVDDRVIFAEQPDWLVDDDVLWERSALKHVAKVKTPVMLQHGENDADVPIAEAEQFYIALRDVGVDAVMIRYPREGHGLREPKHQVDSVNRSIAWYEKYFPK